MKPSKALGRGLSVLLQNKTSDSSDSVAKQEIVYVSVEVITPNTHQPRTSFDHETLEELAASIRQHGVLQPVLLEKSDNGMRLIAGERRFRAAKLAGLAEVPAFVSEYSDIEKREIALVENIQREDLHPLDVAQAVADLIAVTDWTHEEAAKHLGMSRSKLTNLLRLLGLSEMVQAYLKSDTISMSHARALVALIAPQQSELCAYVVQNQVSVRETEEICALIQDGHDLESARALLQRRQNFQSSTDTLEEEKSADPVVRNKSHRRQSEAPQSEQDPEEEALLERITTYFGTRIRIVKDKSGGELRIRYYDETDLTRIVDLLQLPDEDSL